MFAIKHIELEKQKRLHRGMKASGDIRTEWLRVIIFEVFAVIF